MREERVVNRGRLEEGLQPPVASVRVHGWKAGAWRTLHTSSFTADTGVCVYLRWLAQPEDKGRLQLLSAWIWFKTHVERA